MSIARILHIAKSQIGIKEETGNNDGIPAARYMNGDKLPWCAGFVLWVFEQAGHLLPVNKFNARNVSYFEKSMIKAKLFNNRTVHKPLPGDIVFFDFRVDSDKGSGRHVGIVESVDAEYIYTIEGNISNSVSRSRHKIDSKYITGYGWAPSGE